MTVLPDVSAPYQILPPVESLSDDELIEETQRVLCAGTAFHIAAGRYFLVLKERFHGRFIEVVEMRFDQSIDVIEGYMAIAREFPDPNTWRFLPSHWTTLHRLTRINQETRDHWIRDGTIHSRLTHEEAKELVRRANALTNGHDNNDGDGDLDGYEDDRGDDGDDGDHSELGIQTIGRVDNDRDDIGVDSKGELERLCARIEELEAEKRCDERRIAILEDRVAELTAAAGLSDRPCWHQRRQLTRAIDAAQGACQSKSDSDERRRLQMDAGCHVLEIVQSAKRDGLEIGQLDLIYRSRPEQIQTNGESFVPLGTEASAA